MIPIALQLYTVRADLAQDPVRIIKAVAEIGYQGVEGGTPAGMSNQDYLSLLADNNLVLIGSGTSTADLQDNLSLVVERCSELGINTLMCGIGRELRQSDGDWKRVVAGLAEGCAKASEAGLQMRAPELLEGGSDVFLPTSLDIPAIATREGNLVVVDQQVPSFQSRVRKFSGFVFRWRQGRYSISRRWRAFRRRKKEAVRFGMEKRVDLGFLSRP